MKRLLFTPRARRDLEEIWAYTAERWGEDQAARYITVIREATGRIVEAPEIGRPCEELRAGYRRYPAASHILFYRRRTAGIEIVRILHRRMDVDQHL